MSLSAKPSEAILVHGAGGGVGFQAVMVAKALGLKVYANASAADKADLACAGMELAIDFKTADFAEVLKSNHPNTSST